MPIEHSSGGTIVTGDSINYFQLAAQKGVVGLELKGIKMSRGPVLWRRVRSFYAIPGTGKRQATHQQVYDWLCAKLAELRERQTHISTKDGRTVREVAGREVS